MGRRPERERAQHAAEFLLEHVLVVSRNGKGLLHYFGTMIADRA
jgi:hypothetical protein